MATRSVLTAARRHWIAAAAAVAVAASVVSCTCTVPVPEPGTYSGTVVDRETGAPIEGAVILVVWSECWVIRPEGCRDAHTIRETVTGPAGEFSVDAMPDADRNPFSSPQEWPYILVYAVDYLPLSGRMPTVPGFEGGFRAFEQAMRRNPRIPLARRNPHGSGGPYEVYEVYASPPFSGVNPEKLTPNLKRAVDEQWRRILKARSSAPTR